ncbi:MAG: UvrD-helicase domain-containing protein [Treponema sp.]|nr:UvrD-helicase domain-containing protein [Treponema sp.]
MPVNEILNGLDGGQKAAVTLRGNGVVSAGAGSGKTRVLASRYVWLVMEKNLAPQEILTLTFTNKAVSEMYSRIYHYLLEQAAASGGEKAKAALENFYKARISTLDSFSAHIARTAAARYGISPEFSSDDTALRELARHAALRFVLDNREDPAIRQLLVDHKIRKLAEEIFARVVLKHSSISSPMEPGKTLSIQKQEILRAWREHTLRAREITGAMLEDLRALAEMKKSIKFTASLEGILRSSPPPEPPDIAPLLAIGPAGTGLDADLPHPHIRQGIKKYFDYYSAIVAIRAPGNYGEVYAPLVQQFRRLKGKDGDGLYHTLESVANYALNFGLCRGVFELVGRFQDEFNAKKRETGFLSFNDIARLAVDALKDHPDIRKAYKDSIRMIMIDEFQDNNALQRDLVYLLAEDSGRMDKGMPSLDELEKDRMFFVGDEKQSIYRFRGADVAVFRSLGRAIGTQGLTGGQDSGILELAHNYRSRPGLIAAFNGIFDAVFLPAGSGSCDYEAAYSHILPPEQTAAGDGDTGDENREGEGPLAHFCFLNAEDLPEDDTGGVTSQDLEAAFIAGKIRDMVLNKEKIPKRKGRETEWVECGWGDFAVLERTYTHQSALEKHFREFAVPYSTDRPAGLFNDAPVLDIRAYLRLLAYPEDRIAYAALIRSPFMRLSDLSLAACMLSENPEPFAEENEALIPEDDLALYRRARERYRAVLEASRRLSVTELVTMLWFEEGYRYETLWTQSAQMYEGLFDLFFSLASESDRRGKSLAEFIEYLDDVMNREEKPDDRDIPGEGETGVRIMSIHKSKGLEFPVVFVYNCAGAGTIRVPSGLVNVHETYGLILNVPQAEELPLGGNYFRSILLEEERAKDSAELRRLLYVAMTRAECRVFLTFTLPKRTKKEREEGGASGDEFAGKFTGEIIRSRLALQDEKAEDRRDTFLTILAGPLSACPGSLCALEAIPVLTRAEIRSRAAGGGEEQAVRALAKSQREAALAAEPFYKGAKTIPEGKAGPASLDASALQYAPRTSLRPESGGGHHSPSPLDSLLKKAGLDAAQAGTLVHAVLEARLSRQGCSAPDGAPASAGLLRQIPPKILSRADNEAALQDLIAHAEVLAEGFLGSDLGKRWAASMYRESEFSVITSAVVEGKAIAITGQIDLLFEEGGEVVVVDFKTDRTETPEDHYGQLAAYYRAAGDIFGKPVSVWLFYLRSGRAVDVTESVAGICLEELAGAAPRRA